MNGKIIYNATPDGMFNHRLYRALRKVKVLRKEIKNVSLETPGVDNFLRIAQRSLERAETICNNAMMMKYGDIDGDEL